MQQGEISDVKANLSNALSNAFDDRQLKQALEQAGADVSDPYSEAFDEEAAYNALAEAADEGDLGDEYASAFRRARQAREQASSGASNAFSDNDKEALANAAQQADIGKLYRLCGLGRMNEIQSELGLDATPDSTRECQAVVSYAEDLAESYFRGYQEEDSQEQHTIPPELADKFGLDD